MTKLTRSTSESQSTKLAQVMEVMLKKLRCARARLSQTNDPAWETEAGARYFIISAIKMLHEARSCVGLMFLGILVPRPR
jgi:hypothetical protein